MKLTIELDQEADGRWIAEVPELNILVYGDSKLDAVRRAQSAAREIVQAVSPESRSFLKAMSGFVRQRFGVDIPEDAWPMQELPAHLEDGDDQWLMRM